MTMTRFFARSIPARCAFFLSTAIVWCAVCVSAADAADRGLLISTDYPTINDALRALPSHGGEVYVPAGRHVVNKTILLGSGTTLRGAGPQTVLVAGEGLNEYFKAEKCYTKDETPKEILDTPRYRHGAVIKNQQGSDIGRIRIFNLSIEGNREKVNYPAGIILGNVSDVVIRDIRVSDCGSSGIVILRSRDVTVENSMSMRNNNGIVIRGSKENTRDIVISRCRIRDNRWSGIFAFGDKNFLKNGPENLMIVNNLIYDHTNDDGIKLFGCRYVIATGNRIDLANQCAIESHSSRDMVLNSNMITRIDMGLASQGVGICIARSRQKAKPTGYSTVVGNVIGDCGALGIWSEDHNARGFSIIGNVTYGNSQFGMGAGAYSDASFVGNVVLETGRYTAEAPKGRDVSGMMFTAGAKRINVVGNVVTDTRSGEKHLMRDGLTIRGCKDIGATHNMIVNSLNTDVKVYGNRDVVVEKNIIRGLSAKQ